MDKIKNNAPEKSLILTPDKYAGTYSNLTYVHHSDREVVIDFATDLPGVSPVVASRIVLNPAHAKELCLKLRSCIEEYESENGELRIRAAVETVDDVDVRLANENVQAFGKTKGRLS